MKDLDARDILNRTGTQATKLSIRLNGGYQFAELTTPLFEKDGLTYYRIPYDFGLVNSRTQDPNIMLQRGESGDYVTVDAFGELTLITKKVYDMMFPKSNPRPKLLPRDSKKLKDPNYITNIVRKR